MPFAAACGLGGKEACNGGGVVAPSSSSPSSGEEVAWRLCALWESGEVEACLFAGLVTIVAVRVLFTR